MASSFRALNVAIHHLKHKSLSLSKRSNLIRIAQRGRYIRPCHSSFHSSQKCKIYKYCINHYLIRFQSSSSSPSNNKLSSKNDQFHHYLMPKFRDIRQWDKYEWIFSASFLVQFIGFMSYDFMFLRCLSLISASGLMIAHYGRQFFVGWFWAFMMFTANIVTLYYMLLEKYSVSLSGLSEEEQKIYSQIFKPFNIRPLEYKQILRIGKFQTLKSGETLTISGLICDKVYFIVSGQCIVLNETQETIGHISGGNKKSFVGEIALIDDTQDEATATVKTNGEETRLLYWNVNELKHLLSHSKAEFRVKLINVFTSSMKEKLIGLNANFNVENKQKNFVSVIQILLIGKGKLKITEDVNVDREKNEMIALSVDEQLFLTQYAKQMNISDTFMNKMFEKYHIENHWNVSE